MACELKGKFERELGQNPTGVCRSSFYWLLEDLWDLMKTAVRYWKRAEKELEQYIHDHDDQAWEVLKYEVDLSRKEAAGLRKQLEETQEELSGIKQRCRELEGKIRSLERVVAGLQNTLDRANKQGK
jgi:DNA repair exonuclease SbcCD ATPase subunit